MKRLLWLLVLIGFLPGALQAQACVLYSNTASQTVTLGPFVDSTDGDTEKTGLTIANTDIRLSKNGAAWAAKNSGGGTHQEHGWYQATFNATDTNTRGLLQWSVHVSGALPSFGICRVGVPGAIADGTAQGGSSSTIQLAAAENFTSNDIPDGAFVSIVAGTGAGQTGRQITAYTNSTDTATITPNWTTTPDSTSVYVINPFVLLQSAATVAAANWDLARSGHATSGTFGEYIDVAVSSRLAPTTAGRTLDVTATGEAGIDFGNIGNPTTTVNLSGTTVKNATDVLTSLQSSLAVKTATSFVWVMQFKTSLGAVVTSGTPACTRARDNRTFASATNSPAAVDSNGLSTLTLSTTDMTASNFVILKCTLSTAVDYYTTFKVQVP